MGLKEAESYSTRIKTYTKTYTLKKLLGEPDNNY